MGKMKIIVAALSASAFAGSAFAADLPTRKEAQAYVAPAPIFSWTGFYLGVNAGYGWTDNNNMTIGSYPIWVNTVNFGNPGLLNFATNGGMAYLSGGSRGGFAGGGQLGFNYQMGSLVAGLEADISGFAVGRSNLVTANAQPAANSPLFTTITAGQKINWLSTVRGRLGFTVTPTLLAYVTGGLAFGNVTSAVAMSQSHVTAFAIPTVGYSAGTYSQTRTGWTLGGGLEWAFAQNWSARVEYLHYDLGSVTYSGGVLASGLIAAPGFARYTIGSTVNTKYTGNVVRVGLNYKFGWGSPAPVVAKY